MSDGNNNISIISNISDAAGNDAVQDGITLSKDTVDPVITLSNNGNIVNSNVSSYTISGTCSDDRSGVNLQLITIGGSYSGDDLCTTGAFSTNHDVTSLPEGSFSLTANITDAAGNPASQATISSFKDSILPTNPSGITLSEPTPGTIRISFTKGVDTNLDEHKTKYCTSSSCNSGCSSSINTNSPISHTGVAGGNYYGCVRAIDTYGNKSGYIASETSILIDAPPVAGNSGIITNSDTYYYTSKINWTKGTDDITPTSSLKYSIYYSTSSNFDTIAEIESGTAAAIDNTDIDTYTIKTFEPNTTYYVNVIVYDANGRGTPYNKIEIETDDLIRISGVETDLAQLIIPERSIAWVLGQVDSVTILQIIIRSLP